MADSNRVSLGLVEESTFGTTPASPTYEEVRFTSEDLGQGNDTTQSSEIRSDRQIPDIVRTLVTASGGLNFELSYNVTAFELLMKGALAASSTFASVPADTSGTITVDSNNQELTSDGSTPDFTAEPMSVGDWIKLKSGFDSANNGKYVRVTSISASAVGYEGSTLTDHSGGGDEVIGNSSVIRNGTTEASFTVQKQFNDIGNAVNFTGMRVGGMGLTLTPGSIATGNFGLQGVQIEDPGSSFTSLASLTSAATNPVMNSIDGVEDVIVNRASPVTGLDMTEVSMSLTNNLRNVNAIGSTGPVDIGYGTLGVTGTMNSIFRNMDIYDNVINFTSTDLAFVVRDGQNGGYLIDIPNIKPSGNNNPQAGGQDQTVEMPFSFSAFRFLDSANSLDYTIGVHKFSA